MNRDQITGSAKIAKGKILEAIGKTAGDSKLETAGQADQVEGKVQRAIGGVEEALKTI
jgi:uncharacterized protein YjbJ (UPF0337 family)